MKMNFDVDIGEIKPGMILGEDIINNGSLLLSKGMVIKPSYIPNLVARGVSKVAVIAEKKYSDIFLNPVQKFYAQTYECVAKLIDSLKSNYNIMASDAFPVVENILETVFTNKDSILLLTGFRGKGDYYYAHSLDVCIYSLITAKAMKLNYEETVTLGMGALLHDVGKAKISDSILLKKGDLTPSEFEEVKRHCIYGYDIVRSIPGIRPNAARIALQHHERCDGSGYPCHLKGEKIDMLSKIVAIADIYDALTSDRIYREKVLPHEAAEYLLGISNSMIDSKIAKVFLENIAVYPKGCQVLLNTNQVAVVTDSNKNMPLRPLLKIISDKDGIPLQHPFEFDLQSHSSVFIVQMFN